MKTAVIYIRVRVADGSQEVIDRQKAACKQFADEQGFEIVETYIDNEEFGKPVNRVSLSQMIDDSRTATWNAVITYSADRIFRDIRKFIKFEDMLEKYGKSLLIVTAPHRNTEYRQILRELSKSIRKRSKRL